MKIFDYIYYRTYYIYKYKWKDDDPKVYSITLITLLQASNIATLLFIYLFINNKNFEIDYYYSISLFFTIMILNFVRYRKKYINFTILSSRWKDELSFKRTIKGYIIIIYITCSLFCFIKSATL